MISNAAKSFNIFATSLSVLHNYFNSSNKIIFKSKYLAKFLDTLTKLFFSCSDQDEKRDSNGNFERTFRPIFNFYI